MSLRYAALGLLAQHPGSGYDLLKRFELSMAHVWPATQSQLYGELNKLADSGLIEVTAVGPRGRKEYAATDAGRAELLRWILDSGDDPPVRNAELLRVFLLSEIPADEARKHMMAAAEQADADLKHLEQLRDSVAGRRATPTSTRPLRSNTDSAGPPWPATGRAGWCGRSTSGRRSRPQEVVASR